MAKTKLTCLGLYGLLAVVVALLALLGGCSSEQGADVAAEFGGTIITENEVNDYTARYRQRQGLVDDASWRVYLTGQGLSVKEWRESAIRVLATEELVRKRAAEVGIEPREEDVASTIASMKSYYGVAQGDEQAWEEALANIGSSAEAFRRDCEYSSIEQQLILAEKADEVALSEDALQEYLEANLADRVVRDFDVLSFAADEKSEAEAAFAELSSLSGKGLEARFDAMVDGRRTGAPELYGGGLGWDALYSTEGIMDPDVKIKVMTGDLYPELVDAGGQWQIYRCVERFVFEPGVAYGSIESESLKTCIERLAMSSTLSNVADEYRNDLVAAANVQVHPMPSGLPYDVAAGSGESAGSGGQ